MSRSVRGAMGQILGRGGLRRRRLWRKVLEVRVEVAYSNSLGRLSAWAECRYLGCSCRSLCDLQVCWFLTLGGNYETIGHYVVCCLACGAAFGATPGVTDAKNELKQSRLEAKAAKAEAKKDAAVAKEAKKTAKEANLKVKVAKIHVKEAKKEAAAAK